MYGIFPEPSLDPPERKDEPIYVCESCQEGIFDGDEYVDIDGSYHHLYCLEDMSTRELLEFLGFTIHTASSDS